MKLHTLMCLIGCFSVGMQAVDGKMATSTKQTPVISAVLFPDNVIRVVSQTDVSKYLNFSVQGEDSTTTTLVTNQTANRTLNLPDVSGTAVVAQTGTNQVVIGAAKALHNSRAGMQYNSAVAQTAQLRFNQYGLNTGVPGMTTFKSRSAKVGNLSAVNAGDILLQNAAVGVASNLTTPLCALMNINAVAVPAGKNYVASEFELKLVSVDGPAKPRTVFKVSSEGALQLLESTSTAGTSMAPSGVATLNSKGVLAVANTKLPANARVLLTIQPSSKAPQGTVYVSDIQAHTGFTITSTGGAKDAGLKVYYQVYIPLP